MSELLPCPCCDCAADTWYSAQTKRWSVKCYVCGLRTREYDIEQSAIDAWNTRAGGYCAFAQPTDLTDGCALLDRFKSEQPMTDENMAAHGWVRERTCYDKNASAREAGAHCFLWRCSNCNESYDTEMDKMNYCPNCGAKVIQ